MKSSYRTEISALTRRDAIGRLLAGGAMAVALPAALLHAEDERIATAIRIGGTSHALAPGLRLAVESRRALDSVNDYSASFYKEEMVGRKRVNHQLTLKMRETPFSVYLRFENPHKGREVIFIAEKNGGKMLAHGTGIEAIVGTLELDPSSDRALEESRSPITNIGMRKLLELTIAQWNSELNIPDVKVRYFPNAKVANVECRVFESSYAQKHKGVKFHMTRLYVDKETSFPVRVEQFDFPAKTGAQPPIVEQYTYLDVKPNTGLGDIDFDVKNPGYDF
ncbi:MAG: DUF1571 domain-containing protein [Planctomycetota bacterium]|nr:DUF1571 domain-containing protein [Planctomycetota bacterium]